MSTGPVRVLVVEDDELSAQAHADYVRRTAGFELVAVARSAGEAARVLRSDRAVDQIPVKNISADTTVYPLLTDVLFTRPRYPLLFDPTFNRHFGLERKAVQADFHIDYEFESGYTFNSITAYHRDKTSVGIDLNYRAGLDRPNPIYAADPNNRLAWLNFTQWSQGYSRDWSQEIRFTSPPTERFPWMTGGSYLSFASPGGRSAYRPVTSPCGSRRRR